MNAALLTSGVLVGVPASHGVELSWAESRIRLGKPTFGLVGAVRGGGGLQLPSHDDSLTQVPFTHLYFAQLVPLVSVW